MEDAATAEISPLADLAMAPPRPRQRRRRAPAHRRGDGRLGPGYEDARELFEQIATQPDYVEFLTLPAYDRLTAVEVV